VCPSTLRNFTPNQHTPTNYRTNFHAFPSTSFQIVKYGQRGNKGDANKHNFASFRREAPVPKDNIYCTVGKEARRSVKPNKNENKIKKVISKKIKGKN
jgi:hypothetical protein